MIVIELGNIGCEDQAKKIVAKIQGQTYYDFIVQYGVCAGNYPVSVMTEYEGAIEEEVRSMLLFVLACEV
jgi:hypothetical protein